jgi:predicted hydrocarbon binding protein
MQLRGLFFTNRNSYIAGNEPMIFHCHHYNTYLQRTLEDTSHYLDIYPVLVASAHALVYEQLDSHFFHKQISTIQSRKQIAEDFFSFCGFGKFNLDNLTPEGGIVEATADHYSIGWLSKFGKRGSQEKPVSFFTQGYLSGAAEAIFGLPKFSIETTQTHCLTKGDEKVAFRLQPASKTMKKIVMSPKNGVYNNAAPIAPNENIDYVAIRDALTSMPIQGNAKEGLIDAFGVLLTRMYANYYCLISYQMLKMLEEQMGADGLLIADNLLTEAGHVCAFNTFGGIMESAEWNGLIKPMIAKKEDWVHGIVAVVNAFGWGFWEIMELIPNKKLVLKVTSGYESNSYMQLYGKSDYPISFLAKGGAAGIMNLIYNGDISQNPTLDDAYYQKIFKSAQCFSAKQTKCRTMGDEYDLFEVSN